jgi:hypothetical protein
MEFLQTKCLDDALAAKVTCPEAVPIGGGSDVMVEINFDHLRPAQLPDLGRVEELRGWGIEMRTCGSEPAWRAIYWRLPCQRSNLDFSDKKN